MSQQAKKPAHAALLAVSVVAFTFLTTTRALLARPIALLDRRARRDEGGFEIAQVVAIGAMGVLLVILGFTLFKPVITAVIDKIKEDILGAS